MLSTRCPESSQASASDVLSSRSRIDFSVPLATSMNTAWRTMTPARDSKPIIASVFPSGDQAGGTTAPWALGVVRLASDRNCDGSVRVASVRSFVPSAVTTCNVDVPPTPARTKAYCRPSGDQPIGLPTSSRTRFAVPPRNGTRQSVVSSPLPRMKSPRHGGLHRAGCRGSARQVRTAAAGDRRAADGRHEDRRRAVRRRQDVPAAGREERARDEARGGAISSRSWKPRRRRARRRAARARRRASW